ncbi:hypothetical protein [Bacillus sp. NPDC094106]|uniref:hypothetical protein n=1 Tax=Bacillus sp. NPDC094106 TaxID=3363949 RepID=UPI0038037EB3
MDIRNIKTKLYLDFIEAVAKENIKYIQKETSAKKAMDSIGLSIEKLSDELKLIQPIKENNN